MLHCHNKSNQSLGYFCDQRVEWRQEKWQCQEEGWRRESSKAAAGRRRVMKRKIEARGAIREEPIYPSGK